MINVKETTFLNFGNALEITSENLELVVLTDVGPRIISFKLKGKENMFFVDENDLVNGGNVAPYKEKMGVDDVWHLYGGHRLWISPEIIPTATYPDNDKVEYEITKTGVKLKCPVQKYTNLQFETEINVCDEKNEVEVKSTITNKGAFVAPLAPWMITVMDKGGVEVMPLATVNNGCLPNNYITLWPYSKPNDKRLKYFEKYITITQDENIEENFKIGLRAEYGWAAYKNKGCLFVKYFDADYTNGDFPDNGVNYETYTSPNIVEMETLGVNVMLKPGESVEKKEIWNLFELNCNCDLSKEEDIDKMVSKYIK